MFMIAALCILLALLALLLLRTPHPHPPIPVPTPDDHLDPPLPIRHVSFSLVGSDTSYSLPLSPPPTLPVVRRWSSPFHKRKSSASASPCPPQPYSSQKSVDQFGRLTPSSSPASFDSHPLPKSPRRLPTPLRLSLTTKPRSSSVSCTSTSMGLDQVDIRALSPPPFTSPPQSPPPLQRTRFVNPFRKHSRSRTLSPSSTFKSLDASSKPSSTSSSSPPPGRQSLVNKFKSVFKSISPEPSPITRSKPIVEAINTRLRRKPVPRTQPYGPPWNAPMPVPDFSLSQYSLQKHAVTMSPSPQTSRKHSVNESSLPEKTLMSLSHLSPRTFINELDQKLSLLQQQRFQDPIPSPHE